MQYLAKVRFFIKGLIWLALEILNPIIILNINLFMKNNLKCIKNLMKYLLVKCRNDYKTMQYLWKFRNFMIKWQDWS